MNRGCAFSTWERTKQEHLLNNLSGVGVISQNREGHLINHPMAFAKSLLELVSIRKLRIRSNDADSVVGESGVEIGDFDLGHVTACAIMGASRAGCAVMRDRPL